MRSSGLSAGQVDPAGAAASAQAAAIAASAQRASNLSDLASAGTARSNLALGSAAVEAASAFDAAGAADAATPLTTKGDILTFTTVKARLGVGTDGQALVADSAVAAGIKWATLALGLSSGVYDEITYALDIATPAAIESPSWS